MSPLYLNSLDDVLLARIAKKFNTARTGCRFYRSCRAARDVVDLVEPAWPLPLDKMAYESDFKYFSKTGLDIHPNPKLPLEFCRLENVTVCNCSEDFWQNVVIPDMEAVGAVGAVDLLFSNGTPLTEDEVQQLMEAAKPQNVKFLGHVYGATSTAFKTVPNLYVHAYDMKEEGMSCWKSKEIFNLLVDSKTVTWSCGIFHKKAVLSFLENWLKGETTGSLQKLTYCCFRLLATD